METTYSSTPNSKLRSSHKSVIIYISTKRFPPVRFKIEVSTLFPLSLKLCKNKRNLQQTHTAHHSPHSKPTTTKFPTCSNICHTHLLNFIKDGVCTLDLSLAQFPQWHLLQVDLIKLETIKTGFHYTETFAALSLWFPGNESLHISDLILIKEWYQKDRVCYWKDVL